MQKLGLGILAMLVMLGAVSAGATDFKNRQGGWMIGGGPGFVNDPNLFGLQASVHYYLNDEISVGPLFQFDLSDGNYIFGTSGQVRYSAKLEENSLVRPYGQLGIGFVEFKDKDLFNGNYKTSYLFPVGGGFEFKLADKTSLDANVLFNISQDIYMGIFIGVDHIF